MPCRRLPHTNPERRAALDALFIKWNNTQPADRLFPDALFAQMTPLRVSFKKETGEASTALALQGRATSAADLAALALEQVVSHFIQVFNLGVARGVFFRSDRAFYKLDINQSSVPAILSHADRITWAQNLIDGDAARMNQSSPQGGSPATMSMPSIGDVQAALDAYTAAAAAASAKKDAADAEQEDINPLQAPVDKIIKDCWDTIEFNLRDLDGPSRRRKAREWGVVYVARPGEEPDPEPAPEPVPTPNP